MKFCPIRRILSAVFILLSLGVVAQNNKSATSAEIVSGAKAGGKWKLAGNSKHIDTGIRLAGPGARAMLKDRNYTAFALNMDIKTSVGAKGYVTICADNKGNGYRIALDNDFSSPTWWRKTGSLLSVRNLTRTAARDEKWFSLSVEVLGKMVTVRVNDETIVEYIEPERPFRTQENKGARLAPGTIAVVSTGPGSIDFKNVRIQDLSHEKVDLANQLAGSHNEENDDIIKLHQEDFPVLDYHVHLRGDLNKKTAAVRSRAAGINYALAPSCGLGFPIHDDEGVNNFLDTMKHEPYILAAQTEGREWVGLFSREALGKLDFVFTDAMTFDDHKGRRTRLWVEQEVHIDDEQVYMDMIVERTCKVLEEPVDVFVNPFFLPKPMQPRYDEFWTNERIDKVIAVLAKSGKAMEINNRYKIPNKTIIMKAKQAGIKFTFGTNNNTPEVGRMKYAVRMKKECGITSADMYKPDVKP